MHRVNIGMNNDSWNPNVISVKDRENYNNHRKSCRTDSDRSRLLICGLNMEKAFFLLPFPDTWAR